MDHIDDILILTTESAIIGMAIKREIIVRNTMDGGGADILIGLEESDLELVVEMNVISKFERKQGRGPSDEE